MSTATDTHLYDSCAYVAEEIEKAYDSGDLYEWIEDNALDYKFTICSDGSISSASVYVTLGGPTIWVDTGSFTVEGAWSVDRASVCADRDACIELEQILAEGMCGIEVHA